MNIKLTQTITKDNQGNEVRNSAVQNPGKNEIRFNINGKKIIFTYEDYEIFKEIQDLML